MASNNEEKKDNQINNPFSGAATFGLGGAAVTAIGSAIRGNSVHKEAMTVLVGGVVTGAMAGMFGCCLPDTKNASLGFKIAFGTLQSGLMLAALLSAPKMGEEIMDYGTEWSTTVVDGLIGDAVIVGGVVALGTAVVCCVGSTVVADSIRNTIWGNSTSNSTNSGIAIQQPGAVPIAEVVDLAAVDFSMNKV